MTFKPNYHNHLLTATLTLKQPAINQFLEVEAAIQTYTFRATKTYIYSKTPELLLLTTYFLNTNSCFLCLNLVRGAINFNFYLWEAHIHTHKSFKIQFSLMHRRSNRE